MKSHKGFTLIEVMVVVVIIAILVSIAIPSYREYVIRSHRRAAQSAMMEVATRQHQYFVANRTYATDSELGYSLPPEVGDYYDYAVTVTTGPPPGFTITLTAKNSQLSDGNLSLTSEGVKSPAEKW